MGHSVVAVAETILLQRIARIGRPSTTGPYPSGLTVWFWSKELATVEGKHLNITDCEQLEAAIDDHCVFDMKPVKNKNLKI